jgi:hypothetical protein
MAARSSSAWPLAAARHQRGSRALVEALGLELIEVRRLPASGT